MKQDSFPVSDPEMNILDKTAEFGNISPRSPLRERSSLPELELNPEQLQNKLKLVKRKLNPQKQTRIKIRPQTPKTASSYSREPQC